MSRIGPALVAAAMILVLAAPSVQADHSVSTCSGTELPVLGSGGCTLEGLYFEFPNDRPEVEVGTLADGYTFTGKVHVTFDNDTHSQTWWVGMVGGLNLGGPDEIGPMPETDVTVTVDLRTYEGMEPTGTWNVTVNHHGP